jgi:hypothetical protein
MINSEVRCASTLLVVPDYRQELEAERNRAASLVAREQRDNAARLLRFAADELAFGRFPSTAAALEFVLDEVL